MYEDRAIELDAFPAGGHVFCIASAGCTAFELAARGDEVTAVDVNPSQLTCDGVWLERRRRKGR